VLLSRRPIGTVSHIECVQRGKAATVTVGWSGLAAGRRYPGLVEYGDGSQTVGSTVVSVTG
jgi:hypothetical protein